MKALTLITFLIILLTTLTTATTLPYPSPNTINITSRVPRQIPTHERRGLAYNDISLVNFFNKGGSHVTWRYNWDSSSPPSPALFDFVPMLHSVRADHTGRWKENAEAVARQHYDEQNGRATWVLGFNEPDNCTPGAGGSCIDVATAVTGWREHIQPLASLNDKVYLGSPAVTNAVPSETQGLGWLANFMRQCDGCTIDFINVHWYGGPDPTSFKSHISATRALAAGLPIWVTEFKPSGTEYEIVAFLKVVMPWMDDSDDIHRYAYFMATPGEGFLINSAGYGLSGVGEVFNMFHVHGGKTSEDTEEE